MVRKHLRQQQYNNSAVYSATTDLSVPSYYTPPQYNPEPIHKLNNYKKRKTPFMIVDGNGNDGEDGEDGNSGRDGHSGVIGQNGQSGQEGGRMYLLNL
jgi:hypothetical protein